MLKNLEGKIEYEIGAIEEKYAHLILWLKTGKVVDLDLVKQEGVIVLETFVEQGELKEEERVEISEAVSAIWDGMKFHYKSMIPIMPYEYIMNMKQYKERKKTAKVNEVELMNAIDKARNDHVSMEAVMMFNSEKKEQEMKLFAVGEEIENVLIYLKEKGLIVYEKIGVMYFKIDVTEELFKNQKEFAKKEYKIVRMINFARRMKEINYNIWMDYEKK